MKRILIIFAVIACALSIRAQQSEVGDSIKLKDVVVTADRQYVTSEKSVYVPDANQKSTAHDAISLLSRMGIPQLIPSGINSVSAVNGLPISYFINGIPASMEDLNGLLPIDVKRVEYMEYPKDIKFKNAALAINFIVVNYKWGGYTKLMAAGNGPAVWSETFKAYSKFAYKRMTFSVDASQNYSSNKNEKNSEIKHFKFDNFRGEGPKEIEIDQQTIDSNSSFLTNNLGFRAVYSSEKVQVNNMATVSGTNTPAQWNHYDVKSTLPELSTGKALQRVHGSSISAGFSSETNIKLSNASLLVNYTAQYSRSKSNQSYISDEQALAETKTNETGWMQRFWCGVQNNFGKGHSFLPQFQIQYDWTDTNYPLTQSLMKMSQLFAQAALQYSYGTQKVRLFTNIGYNYIQNTVQHERAYSCSFPSCFIYFSYTPTSKHQISINPQFQIVPPDYAALNPAVQNPSPLLWTQGNPNLRSTANQTLTLAYLFLPSNKWQFNAACGNEYNHNAVARIYTPEGPNGEMLAYFVSSGDSYNYWGNASATCKLFHQRLILNGGVAFNRYVRTGEVNYNATVWNGTLNATYFYKAMSFSAFFQTPAKWYSTLTGGVGSSAPSWSVNVNYNLNNWNFGITLTDFANWNYKHTVNQSLNTPYYAIESRGQGYRKHACASLRISYTFRYGKRIAEGDESIKTAETKTATIKD